MKIASIAKTAQLFKLTQAESYFLFRKSCIMKGIKSVSQILIGLDERMKMKSSKNVHKSFRHML